MKVNIKNIADELQTISDGDCLFYNKITGETEWFGEELGNPNALELDDIEEDENFVCLHRQHVQKPNGGGHFPPRNGAARL